MRATNLDTLTSATRGPLRFGLVIAFGFLILAVVSGTQIDLPRSFSVTGTVRSETPAQIVRAPLGGTITQIDVHAGDTVEAGQRLFQLDASDIQRKLQNLRRDRLALSMESARLNAQLSGAMKIDHSNNASSDAERRIASELLALEQAQLDAHREAQTRERAYIQNRIDALLRTREQTTRRLGFEERQVAQSANIVASYAQRPNAVAADETELKKLRQVHLALQAGIAGTQTDLSRLNLDLATARNELDRLERSGAIAATRRIAELSRLIQARSDEISAMESSLAATAVKSPVAGTVANMNNIDMGAAVSSFQPVMEIIPSIARHRIEVQIPAGSIHKIRFDMPALVSFGSTHNPLNADAKAHVTYIAQEASPGSNGSPNHFIAHLSIRASESAAPGSDFGNADMIAPGTPVYVRILGEPRTLFEYISQPVRRAFKGAFSAS
ncbi:MAG: HlyD family efflux transporter periplasmic adaptor subunit [Pseudomonadota bacterium]